MNDGDVSYRQNLHDLLTLLTGQWTVAIIATLAVGERRFTDLLAEVNETEARLGWISHTKPLSRRVLTDTLRRLEADELVERRADGEHEQFSKVSYRLSPDGRALLGMLRPLASWAGQRRVGGVQPDPH
ncbi:winged helix-turn-helix transcriptional regulator [Amycolatopsis saalfeldensis]|uniref:DNA-binding transcriptional regulator, HxlR family n=1 Tax=Amycolatopsis saalfeldensis TaxID=394193 RepID=A0A1H8YPV9_9PSEU|nr:helix-turn-helix domain-containing protein [Amycolatopsis saalfeldensis]SEP54072.1 DNA-binding transcriptional regulator, HxlR family [Amycolatopsis saalfeldensis]